MLYFQFHKGTIKPSRFIFVVTSLGTFNSIKVQLSPATFGILDEFERHFQFHKGTIKPRQ